MGNALLEKKKMLEHAAFQCGYDVATQKFFDLLCVTLNDREIMGRDAFGADRLRRLAEGIYQAEQEWQLAWSKDAESDYYQQKLDERLREIFGDDAIPFSARYPGVKQWVYPTNGRKKAVLK